MILKIILTVAFAIAMLMSLYARIKIDITFRKYSRVPTSAKKTGAEVARGLLSSEGIFGIEVVFVRGHLVDHYDASARVLRLSKAVHDSSSTAAVGIAAHEVAHAIQHERGYFPMVLRSILVPVTHITSRLSWFVISFGVIISMISRVSEYGHYIILGGIALFSTTALIQLATLPCEINASKRAIAMLREGGQYSERELECAEKVLSAAAMTYVASLLISVIQVLRLGESFGARRRP